MEPKPKPNDLTPEERLFKIIQESERSENKDDTLVVASEIQASAEAEPKGVLPVAPDRPEKFADDRHSGDIFGAQDAGVEIKKARRALSLGAFVDDVWMGDVRRRVFSIRTLNRALAVCLAVLVAYFFVSQALFRRSPGAAFAQKAESARTPVLEVPSGLFALQNLEKQVSDIAKRNIFQPRSEAPRDAAAGTIAVTPPGTLDTKVANLKLSGIYAEGNSSEALVEAIDEKKTYMVTAGTQFKGLTVKEVKEDGILLTDGQSEFFLR